MRATDIAIIVQALFQILFDGYSCVRKMRHLLQTDFEDVSSFLNQLKSTRYLKILHCILRVTTISLFLFSKQIESVHCLFMLTYRMRATDIAIIMQALFQILFDRWMLLCQKDASSFAGRF